MIVLWGMIAGSCIASPTSQPSGSLSLLVTSLDNTPWDCANEQEMTQGYGIGSVAANVVGDNLASLWSGSPIQSSQWMDLGCKQINKEITCGVHMGQKTWAMDPHVSFFQSPTRIHSHVMDIEGVPTWSPLTYAGWNIQHAVSPSFSVTYSLSVGKMMPWSDNPPANTLDSPVTESFTSDVLSSESSSSPLMDQAVKSSPEPWNRRFFAEALITFVYSFCNWHK
jgi:hypothetical protein